jgi:outer membrane receptor for ferrienterochelin and colicin
VRHQCIPQKGNGGFGDSRITIRGLDNITVMINGVPVMIWNIVFFWSIISQDCLTLLLTGSKGFRLLKIVSASVGGSINIITKRLITKKVERSVLLLENSYLNIKPLIPQENANGLSASVLFSQTRW